MMMYQSKSIKSNRGFTFPRCHIKQIEKMIFGCLSPRGNAVATAVFLAMLAIASDTMINGRTYRFRDRANEGKIQKSSVPETSPLYNVHREKKVLNRVGDKSSLEPRTPLQKQIPRAKADTNTHEQLPPLETLIGTSDNKTANKDVQKLLFASILGFPKCGTTTLMHWMSSHPELCVYEHEYRYYGKPSELASMLYKICPNLQEYGKRIFKNPNQLYYRPDPQMLRDHFPKTKLIIGVRAPVSWFPSFYNFRIRSGYTMPSPLDFLSGATCDEGQGLCVERAYLATFLAFLGKTAVHHEGLGHVRLDSSQLTLVNTTSAWRSKRVLSPALPNEIFLYDVSQLDFDQNLAIANKFRRDVSSYLELQHPLKRSDIVHSEVHSENPNTTQMLNICDPRLEPLKQKLLEIGKTSSDWILKYFLPHPTVTVSSPEYFKRTLQRWDQDPCVAH